MTTAIYPGTFDPFTRGHLFITRQAASLFDHVVVLLAVHPTKTPLFSERERLEMMRAVTGKFPNVQVASTRGLVVEYAREIGASAIVRGVRDAPDSQYETQLAQLNWSLAPDIATVMIPSPPELLTVSSTQVKAIARSGGDLSAYCPDEVTTYLRQKFFALEVSS